jgi:exodeoxyribonuclease VII large subunit
VVWKGSVRGLGVRPEQGLEVIVTGKITTYPAGSRYQIVIETMEAAGVGALLAQLERLKAKLAGEGLFEASRKRPLPSMPAVIGVVTSPTGAVIRDILHRIRDRWPCRVIVWPVVVQGDKAAGEVRAAIEGFNALTPDGPLPRPDIIIVARGGGSVEDLWAFNDETLARAVAASTIPLISAVGHETDTTLIDFVSDRRAPTPTAAAEMATPSWPNCAPPWPTTSAACCANCSAGCWRSAAPAWPAPPAACPARPISSPCPAALRPRRRPPRRRAAAQCRRPRPPSWPASPRR